MIFVGASFLWSLDLLLIVLKDFFRFSLSDFYGSVVRINLKVFKLKFEIF